MENKNINALSDFHSVEFMRKVRNELTEQFLVDKNKYLEFLKQAMENFKKQQVKQKN